MKVTLKLRNILLGLAPIVLALLFTTLILVAVGAPPGEAYRNILSGAFESPQKIADVAAACVLLILCGVGMSITFTAGQWNVGVEGQIILGAIFATWVARNLLWPQVPVLTLMLLAGMVGGALVLTSDLAQLFGLIPLNGTIAGICALPIFAFEIWLAVYLIVRGLRGTHPPASAVTAADAASTRP